MPYVGQNLGLVTRLKFKFTAKEGQTVITGLDDNNNNFTYDPHLLSVYLNGIKLISGVDYDDSFSGRIEFTSKLKDNDVVEVITDSNYSIANPGPHKHLSSDITDLYSVFVGSLSYFLCKTPPNGWLVCDGSLLSRSAYSNLWNFASNSKNIIDDKTWTSSANYKGAFSTGDNSTTFRLPALSNVFLRSSNTSDTIGTYQGDAIRNFTGWFGQPPNVVQYGGIYDSDSWGGIVTPAATQTYVSIIPNYRVEGNGIRRFPLSYNINASLQVPVADENRPKNVSYLLCIKY